MTDAYESLGVIASALYGDVHKLRHVATGRLAAVKHMDLHAAARRRTKDSNRPIEEDVFLEVQTNLALRRLGGHRHIVSMLDCIVDDRRVSLLTEFCDRGELLDVLNARGSRLGVEDAMRFFYQISQALAFLHANNIAHRDLSLENVLVDAKNDAKLSDFGMATTSKRMRATGIGKVQYMAPEACCGGFDQPTTTYNPFEADMWSLGVILFTLLTGQYPFKHAMETDPHFVLLGEFGVECLLELYGFDPEGYEDIVDVLAGLLAVNPATRITVDALMSHECFDIFRALEQGILLEDDDEDEFVPSFEHHMVSTPLENESTDPVDPVEEDENELDVEHDTSASENSTATTSTTSTPTKSFQYGVANLFVLRRPPSIDTSSIKSSCTLVVAEASTRKSPANLKEQRHSVIALTPKYCPLDGGSLRGVSRTRRRTPKCRKKFVFGCMLDGVFRRKKSRVAAPHLALTTTPN